MPGNHTTRMDHHRPRRRVPRVLLAALLLVPALACPFGQVGAQYNGGPGRGQATARLAIPGQLVAYRGGQGRGENAVRFATTGQLVAYRGGQGRGESAVRFATTGQLVAYHGGHGRGENAVRFATAGQLVAYRGGQGRGQATAGFLPLSVRANVRAYLEGPYVQDVSLPMSDDLRAQGLLPLTEPYTALGYTFAGEAGGESTTSAVMAVTGSNAIVDWVLLELRDDSAPAIVVAARAALLQRDGDVVEVDGISPVRFNNVAPGNYHVAVRHRNHLGTMSLDAIALSPEVAGVDFTLPGLLPTWGVNAMKTVGIRRVLWAGDVNFDGTLRYTGAANDRDIILQLIGGAVPTNTVSGYVGADVDLDGNVRYTGAANDRDPILQNIGGTVPTNTRVEQVP
ncbi:MAG: hypothetical protein RBT71_02005 [Flavobacteriales bacterium]|jgi:hypothetical protein|nr:hypothetical protein [Flavobacteriales bacterium]